MDHVRHVVDDLPPGCEHTMAFWGVGDHGGGPTEQIIQWIRDNRDSVPGARMEFSTMERAFNAMEQNAQLPEVIGEIQHHSIGCYVIERNVKGGVRRAEHALARAQAVASDQERFLLTRAWQSLASHHFHDTLGGTCLPESYPFVIGDLGGACALAEEVVAYGLRRRMAKLPGDPLPRLVLANPGSVEFNGWHMARVWTERDWKADWRLLDEEGMEIPFQRIGEEIGHRCILFHSRIPADGLRTYRLDLSQPRAITASRVRVASDRIGNDSGLEIRAKVWGQEICCMDRVLPLGFHLVEDGTDTWSHDVVRYAEGPSKAIRWDSPEIVDRGPLRAAFVQRGTIGDTRLTADWRVYADNSVAELVLDVDWRACQQVLKLVFPLNGEQTRMDGTPGMALGRQNDSRERPLQDWTLTETVGVVCPDAWAIDASPERVRLTLMRAPFYALHGPIPGVYPRAILMDQGLHRFRFRFHLQPAKVETLQAEAMAFHRPPLDADVTQGMPTRYMRDGAQRRQK